jgi:deoxyribonuclease (pyrimidine dimer)
MTRINADLDPKRLTDQHLLAEYNEMAMVYASLRRSLRSYPKHKVLERIPKNYVLGSGHVMFFYNKLIFLNKRYQLLVDELVKRNYNLNENRVIFSETEFDPVFYNDWTATDIDRRTISERLIVRINKKPQWYKYHKAPIESKFIEEMYGEYLR